MTVAEVIRELQKLDQKSELEIAICTYTREFPVAYVRAFVAHGRMYAHLPQGYSVSRRKEK
jgi:hypothetical protein